MTLTAGLRLGPYEIIAQIGVGGMGEVWCATDTNLGRQVAIKILPDAFAHDPERLARFEREAKTLASLNHPNIAQIYGLEKTDSIRALVMELIEGPTLADRIGQGPIPIDDSPDGLRIMYEVISARHAVWVSSVADGRGVPLDQESPDQHSPAWSPDGKWIAYQRLQGTNWELVKVPSGGGKPVRLAEATPGGGLHTAWSPTGEWIAHVTGGALRLTSAAEGQTQKALSGSPPEAFGFSLDGSLLYAVRHPSVGMWQLVTFDVQSGKEQKVTGLQLPPRATLTGFSVDPNGKSFATAIGIARHDIWLLEGFKPASRWFEGF